MMYSCGYTAAGVPLPAVLHYAALGNLYGKFWMWITHYIVL